MMSVLRRAQVRKKLKTFDLHILASVFKKDETCPVMKHIHVQLLSKFTEVLTESESSGSSTCARYESRDPYDWIGVMLELLGNPKTGGAPRDAFDWQGITSTFEAAKRYFLRPADEDKHLNYVPFKQWFLHFIQRLYCSQVLHLPGPLQRIVDFSWTKEHGKDTLEVSWQLTCYRTHGIILEEAGNNDFVSPVFYDHKRLTSLMKWLNLISFPVLDVILRRGNIGRRSRIVLYEEPQRSVLGASNGIRLPLASIRGTDEGRPHVLLPKHLRFVELTTSCPVLSNFNLWGPERSLVDEYHRDYLYANLSQLATPDTPLSRHDCSMVPYRYPRGEQPPWMESAQLARVTKEFDLSWDEVEPTIRYMDVKATFALQYHKWSLFLYREPLVLSSTGIAISQPLTIDDTITLTSVTLRSAVYLLMYAVVNPRKRVKHRESDYRTCFQDLRATSTDEPDQWLANSPAFHRTAPVCVVGSTSFLEWLRPGLLRWCPAVFQHHSTFQVDSLPTSIELDHLEVWLIETPTQEDFLRALEALAVLSTRCDPNYVVQRLNGLLLDHNMLDDAKNSLVLPSSQLIIHVVRE